MEPSAERSHRRSPVRHSVLGSLNKKKIIVAAAGLVVIAVVGVAGLLLVNNSPTAVAVDSSKYQAVFFTNGQVYFGKLKGLENGYFKLTDIYYLQAQTTEDTDAKVQKTADSSANNPQLIKLGDEIHGPTDEMVINKDQVLFYENLKSDGKVSASIAKYKNPNK